jgi:hypothetical protein
MPASARLVSVAAHGLAGSRTDLPSSPLSEGEWFDLVQACVAADLIGLLAAAATSGHMPVTDGQAEELSVLEAERAGLSQLVEQRAVTVAAVLAAAGIDYRIMDGPARRLAYGGAASRHFGDVQVLVAPERIGAARALQGPLLSVAGRPVQRHDRVVLRSGVPGLGKEADDARAPRADDPAAAPAEVDALQLLGPAVPLDLAGHAVAALTVEQQLVVTCVEATAHPAPALAVVRDIAEIALCASLDSTAARRLAETTGVVAALAAGIALAWDRFDLADKTELSVWALRRDGSRYGRPSSRRSTPPLARAGLAQRVLGRRQPLPARATGGPTLSTTTSPLSGSGRSARPTRRSP